MRKKLTVLMAMVASGVGTHAVNAAAPQTLPAARADTVHVAPPTGEMESDRASIVAALDRVRPSGTIQFGPGTYLVGEIIHVTVPGITLLGHHDGTTLRGCDPGVFQEMLAAVVQCNGLDLAGGHQTVRSITFEFAWHAIVLGGLECGQGGCRPFGEPVESRSGGYLVESNTFRSSSNGIRTMGQWTEPALIRHNNFVNTFHAVVVHGSTVHILDNSISAPEPEHVPTTGHPGGAVTISATDLNAELSLECSGNVIADNRIEGHTDAIVIALFRPGTSCRDNAIRDNTIQVARVKVPASWAGVRLTADADSTVVGVPIALVGSPIGYGDFPVTLEITEQEPRLEANVIEGNRIIGAEGLGIEIFHASRNRIANNTISRIAQRNPYPGITVNSTDPERAGWREANGSGIWVSPASDENEISGNTFEEIATHAIVLEGSGNVVELESASDSVRDLGTRNRVTRRAAQ